MLFSTRAAAAADLPGLQCFKLLRVVPVRSRSPGRLAIHPFAGRTVWNDLHGPPISSYSPINVFFSSALYGGLKWRIFSWRAPDFFAGSL
jgi:hypothetical protein